jgi:hypothetical protein
MKFNVIQNYALPLTRCSDYQGKIHVSKNEDGSRHFIEIKLNPGQFVILTNRNI